MVWAKIIICALTISKGHFQLKNADKINCAHEAFEDIVNKHQMTISTSLNLFFDRNLNISIIRLLMIYHQKMKILKWKILNIRKSENPKHCVNVFIKMFIKCLRCPDHFIPFPKTFDLLIYLKSILLYKIHQRIFLKLFEDTILKKLNKSNSIMKML